MGCSVGWFVGWLVGQTVGSLPIWLVCLLVNWFTGRSVGRSKRSSRLVATGRWMREDGGWGEDEDSKRIGPKQRQRSAREYNIRKIGEPSYEVWRERSSTRTSLLLALVVRQLIAHPFRDGAPFLPPIGTPSTVGRSLRCFHVTHEIFFSYLRGDHSK